MSRPRPICARSAALPLLLVWQLAWQAPVRAEDCPRAGTLGTSRVLSVDAEHFPRVGLKSFPQTLPLRDHEVVLTFDDGPWPPTTPKVLKALAQECVRATFFLIGKPASEHPDLVRRIAAEGHTVGHHTWLHRSLKQIPPGETTEEIDHGISAVEMALHGQATTTPSTPFFRFPGSPQQELKLLIKRLTVARKGIILLHDPKAHTAAMLPAFLRWLRENDYHIVHLVPTADPVSADGH